jgi:ethanolamine utilization protein EutN
MQLGRVIGNIVCSMKDVKLTGRTLLVVQPLDGHGHDTGRALVAVDSIGAGVGEIIYWCRGKEASFPFLPDEVPTEASIVGTVDEMHLGAERIKF